MLENRLSDSFERREPSEPNIDCVMDESVDSRLASSEDGPRLRLNFLEILSKIEVFCFGAARGIVMEEEERVLEL